MPKIAVIKTGGKQYLVHEGDSLRVEKLLADGSVKFNEVLLTVEPDGSDLNLGAPHTGTTVTAKVAKQGRAKKVLVIHYKAKVRYHKKYGHRQPFTEVKVEKI